MELWERNYDNKRGGEKKGSEIIFIYDKTFLPEQYPPLSLCVSLRIDRWRDELHLQRGIITI
jgi:hypothetical protein